MAIVRTSKSTGSLILLLTAAMMVAPLDPVHAQRRNEVGAAAAGVALGLIIGGMASQANTQPPPQQQGGGEGRSYRACSTIYGSGATNASGNPGRCVCQSGYTWTNEGGNKRCIPRNNEANRAPAKEPASSVTTRSAPSRAEIEKIQESLNLLGYDAGSVDGSMGQKTQQAISKFQGDKQLPQTGHLSAAEQQLLFKDVDARRTRTVSTPVPIATSPPAPEPIRAPEKADVRIELAHWETVRSSRVTAELEDYIAKYPIGEFTKLASLRLEQLKDEDRKVLPQPLPVEASKAETGKPAAITAQLPPIDAAVFPKARQRRSDAVAVIIGNSGYRNGVPSVDFGVRDAEAMKAIATKTLGLETGNIIFLKDATRGALDEVFGTDKNHKGKLWRLIDPDGRSDVYIFYSGHGVPGTSEADGIGNFLLPVDGDPNHASLNGYPLSLLYKNLGALKTQSTTVFLDACFSGQSPDPSTTQLIKSASPVYGTKVTPSDASKINVFAAAGDRQLASWDSEAGHGIFTRYVLAGLAGEADDDKDKTVTAKELQAYLSRQVRKAARRTHGREQEPQFTGNGDFVISSF